MPGQTINVDLCLVPADHALDHKLPAVSCSSGRLVVERDSASAVPPDYPGQAFADPELAYADAMQAFVAASGAPAARRDEAATDAAATTTTRATRQALRQDARALRDQRRQVRTQRRLEDAAWQTLRAQRRADCRTRCRPTTRHAAASQAAQDAQWRAQRAQRRTSHAQRQQADAQWRAQRQELRQQLNHLPRVTAWIAILVITDNCTRQCLGLPLFVAGAKVTAAAVVAALRALLPTELQFLISDRGVHFTAQVFQQLARDAQFLHVVIARHRPESNGIAERFVRTLKEWLADNVWISEQELARLLDRFEAEYNDRPHQGIAIPGLSPNEFAERIWLF